MLTSSRWMLTAALIVSALTSGGVRAADADEMVANPKYKFWATAKPGSVVTQIEKTVFAGVDKESLPDGVDEKTITTKLLSVTPESVVVETVVSEREFLGVVESAPTKTTYYAKIKKSYLQAALNEIGAELGTETVDVLGKKLDCKTLSGSTKKDDTVVDHKVWYSETIPGGVVKRMRTTKQDGKVVAETTITLKSFKTAE
jgi:hypothetical protein